MIKFHANNRLLFAFLAVFGTSVFLAISWARWEDLTNYYELRQQILVRQWFGGYSSLLDQQDAILSIAGEHLVTQKARGADPKDIQGALDKIMELNPEFFSGFALTSPQGEVLNMSSNLESNRIPNLLESPETRDTFIQALQSSRMVLGRTYFAPRFVVPARKAIRNDKGETVAVMTGALRARSGSGFFGNNSTLGTFNRITILRADDRYIQYATNGELLEGFHEAPLTENNNSRLMEALTRGARDDLSSEMADSELISFVRRTEDGRGKVRGVAIYHPDHRFWLISEVRNDHLTAQFRRSVFGYSLVLIMFLLITRAFFRYIDKNEGKRRRALKFQATHDPLTGLPNRNYLVERFPQWVAEETNFSLLFVDLDSFKGINDNFGHSVGDRLLEVLARRFSALGNERDLLIRHGGDEFVLLVSGSQPQKQTAQICTRIFDVCQNIPVDGMVFSPGCSIGIAHYPDHGQVLDELLRAADLAMYEAKKQRNTYRHYHPDIEDGYVQQSRIEHLLRGAVQRSEIYMNYQPQVDGDGRLRGVESLVRWKNPELGFVPPDQFIGVAERTGQMPELGRFILQQSLSEYKAFRVRSGRNLGLAINISVRQFAEADFSEYLLESLKKFGLENESVCLEITESTLVEDLDRVQQILWALHGHGLGTSLDDFGTGYSSLAILKDLPFDEIKIDKSFVDNIMDDESGQHLVRNIISIGHNYGMTVLAEGVETRDQFELLKSYGCDLFQGYYFSRPLSIEALETFAAQSG